MPRHPGTAPQTHLAGSAVSATGVMAPAPHDLDAASAIFAPGFLYSNSTDNRNRIARLIGMESWLCWFRVMLSHSPGSKAPPLLPVGFIEEGQQQACGQLVFSRRRIDIAAVQLANQGQWQASLHLWPGKTRLSQTLALRSPWLPGTACRRCIPTWK